MDEDKLIEELDVDFISGILAPSDLQMADNMIDDLMVDFGHHNRHQFESNNPNMHNYLHSSNMIDSNNNFIKMDHQILSENFYNSTNMNTSGSNLEYTVNSNLLVNQLEHRQQFNHSGNRNDPSHAQILYNQQQVIISNPLMANNFTVETNKNQISYPIQSNISYIPVNNNNYIIEPDEPVKKARKNLKDILKNERATNYNNTLPSNTIFNMNQTYINQNQTDPNSNNFFNENQIESNKSKRRSINSLINGDNNKNTFSNNNIKHTNINHPINYPQPLLSAPIIPTPIQIINDNVKTTSTSAMQSQNIIVVQNNDSTTTIPILQLQTNPTEALRKVPNSPTLIDPENSPKNQHRRKIKNNKEDLDEEQNQEENCGKKQKFHKKTAHNAIEKKYRSSINDKIAELKVRVAGPDVKLQKSGILRKALEYITNIENMNQNLSNENKNLKSALKTISLNINNPSTIMETLNNVNYSNSKLTSINKLIGDLNSNSMPNTPPSLSPSDGDSIYSTSDSSNDFLAASPSSQSSSSMTTPTKKSPNKKHNKRLSSNNSMQDASRIMLCMFVMSVLFFNPFNLILSKDSNDQTNLNIVENEYNNKKSFNVRVLNSIDSIYDSFDNGSSTNLNQNKSYQILNNNFLISWFLNILLIMVCLVIIYINSEPRMNKKMKKIDESVLIYYKKASKSFQSKDYEEALTNCELGLLQLGLSIPKTNFQLTAGIIWQMFRIILAKLYLGVFLSRLALWYNNINNMKLHKMSALFYYEMHKFSYLNIKSVNDFVPNATSSSLNSKQAKKTGSNHNLVQNSIQGTFYYSFYSYLTAIYYILANYNMTEMYTRFEKNNLSIKDEFSLIEYYLSSLIYLKFFLPKNISRKIIKYIIKKKLINKINYDSNKNDADYDSDEERKLNQIKNLLKKNIFIEFLVNFENYSNTLLISQTDEITSFNQRQKLLNLISYRRKMFSTPYLYDLYEEDLYDEEDDEDNFEEIDQLCVATNFIITKFQDHILFKMTNHIINQSSMISVDEIINSSKNISINSARYLSQNNDPIDLNEEQIEVADIDQAKFERLKSLYKQNADCFTSKYESEQETQLILTEFLTMLNNWKLRKFNDKLMNTSGFSNVQKNYFVESLIHILRAYENIQERPLETIENCRKSIEFLNKFKNTTNYYTSNNHLVEKFEILMYDWILSAKTYLWTKNKLIKLDLFNDTLHKYQNIIVSYPQLNSKAKMYETIIMYASNRNPIGLQKQTARQTLFSKCNQEAFLSMSSILKSFHLQIIE